ncbi:MAG: FG-GAP repeat domain-containing protein, partial [Paracoccaceae bacterium]
MRGALAALLLGLAGPVSAGPEVLSAHYDEPTTRYAHGVLGDTVEWGALVMRLDTCPECALLRTREYRIELPESRVFEDLEPRVLDLDRDGDNEILVIESHGHKGAWVADYDENGLLAYGTYRMRRFRWLAIIGAADFDNDGQCEVVASDPAHLGKKLRV